ncbi:T9SS type A sorting domain-containing protein [Candidatus Latescibacterota bacterium]
MKKKLFTVILAFGFICQFTTSYAEEYRILVLRVDFPFEDPDHYTTSGRGVFDLRDYYSDPSVKKEYTHPWDIPPHNKRYVENHLEALKNYWRTVSENRVNISYEVWPEESDKAYTMSKKFYKYGNGRTKEQTFEKLVSLFEEAITTCKNREGSNIDFSQFDTFIIIHAGLGRETSGGVINDIPSAYISREDFDTYLGTSLTVDDITIEHGIIVPEMASTNGIYGLNGIIAQMFGFRLGLPSFSNNKEGISGAGGWCLMDTGNMVWGYGTLGFIPTHPCIWSKIELGWIEPVTVTSDMTLDIAATHLNTGQPRGIKVPITNDEYLLIENRYNYAPADSLPKSITFSDTDTSGVWIDVDHYDAFIPGKGILIWHVNGSIIESKMADNTINDDPYRRGLYLLEADGRQDIGTTLLFGDKDDPFKLSGNNVLSPQSNPDSGSMWGGKSGITVRVNSNPGEIMNVAITFTGKMKGFPLSIGTEGNITAVDMNNDGVDELIVSGVDSTFVYSVDGTLIGSFAAPGHPAAGYNNKTGAIDLFPFDKYFGMNYYHMTDASLDIMSPGFALSLEGTYIIEGNTVIIDTPDGWINFVTYRRIDLGGRVSSNIMGYSNDDVCYFTKLSDSTGVNSFAVENDYLAALSGNNTLYLGYLVTESSSTMSPYQTDADTTRGPLLVDLDRDDNYETVITADMELLIFSRDGTYERIFLPDKPVGSPVAADIDSDGYPEIIQCTTRQVYGFRRGGIPVENFPFDLPPGDDTETITSPPVVIDLNNDGSLDVACTTSNMRLVSFDPSGHPTTSFPITTIGTVTSSPCIFKLSGSGDIAVAYITNDGRLMAHDLMTTVEDELYQWPMWKGGPELTSAFLNSKITSDVRTSAPFEAFCYPNPITGNVGTFRITPSGPTDCSITVYTVDGRKVFDSYLSQNEIIPGVANEVRMNATNLSSGLYIAKIKTRQKTIVYKLGVLK